MLKRILESKKNSYFFLINFDIKLKKKKTNFPIWFLNKKFWKKWNQIYVFGPNMNFILIFKMIINLQHHGRKRVCVGGGGGCGGTRPLLSPYTSSSPHQTLLISEYDQPTFISDDPSKPTLYRLRNDAPGHYSSTWSVRRHYSPPPTTTATLATIFSPTSPSSVESVIVGSLCGKV